MVVERSSTLVKAACMPRLSPPEALAVEVMAELVAEGAEERAERGYLFPDGGPHPETDEHRFGMVVPEQFNSRTAFADSKRAGCKYSDPGLPNLVESRCDRQKLRRCLANGRGRSALHGGSDRLCQRLQLVVLGDFQRCEPVALKKPGSYRCCARRSVGKHPWKLSTQRVEVLRCGQTCFIQSPVFMTRLNRIC